MGLSVLNIGIEAFIYLLPITIYWYVFVLYQKVAISQLRKAEKEIEKNKDEKPDVSKLKLYKHKVWRMQIWNTKIYYEAQQSKQYKFIFQNARLVKFLQLSSFILLDQVIYRYLQSWFLRIPITIMFSAFNFYLSLSYESNPKAPPIPRAQQINGFESLIYLVEDMMDFQQAVWATFPVSQLPKKLSAYSPYQNGLLAVDSGSDFQLFLAQSKAVPERNRVTYVGGGTMLHWVAYYPGDTVEIIRDYLLQRNANLACRDDFSHTPLHYAVYAGSTTYIALVCNIVRQTKQGNPSQTKILSAPNRFGVTPLHAAVVLQNYEMMKMLIDSGADVNARDQLSRSTPLLVAMSGHIEGIDVEKVTALMIAGLNFSPFKQDIRGMDAIQLTIMDGDKQDTFKQLLQSIKKYKHTEDQDYQEGSVTPTLGVHHLATSIVAPNPFCMTALLAQQSDLIHVANARSVPVNYAKGSRCCGIDFQPEDINLLDMAGFMLLIELQHLLEDTQSTVQFWSNPYLNFLQERNRSDEQYDYESDDEQEDEDIIKRADGYYQCTQLLVKKNVNMLKLVYVDLESSVKKWLEEDNDDKVDALLKKIQALLKEMVVKKTVRDGEEAVVYQLKTPAGKS